MKSESLATQIDKLVRDHLAQVQAEAESAMRRASAVALPREPNARTTKRAPSKRRDPSEVAALAEKLHARIVAEPGESMTVHARHLGMGVRDLRRPMAVRRRAGRLRTTGVRNNTRDYPTPGS
jgi:hypothetical protein